MQKHLCLIIDRYTRETYAEYEIELTLPTQTWYNARQIASEKFVQDHPGFLKDWVVDSVEI